MDIRFEGTYLTKINDCRKKEVLSTKRVGGDFEIRVTSIDGMEDAFWLEMKKPYKETAKKLEHKFEEIKAMLEGQE